MKYMLLIYGNENHPTTEAEDQAELNAYWAFDNEVKARGIFVAGEGLLPTPMSTTVQVREGKTLHTDGPFIETQEQLGGFYLLECKDLDEAIEWAAKIPGAKNGAVEIRPVLVFN